MPPLVSIIIPVYNAMPYLKEALESSVNQTFRNIEIIVIDDASLDRSLEVCKEFLIKDNRIKIIKLTHNKGVGYARNIGLKVALGHYVLFLDADDCLEKDAVSILYRKAKRFKIELILFGFHQFWGNKEYSDSIILPTENFKEKDTFSYFLLNQRGFGPFAWLYFYERSFLERNNIVFPEGCFYKDIPFTAKAVFYSNKLVVYRKRPLYHYRRHSKSITRNVSLQKIKDRFNAYGTLEEFLKKQEIKEKYQSEFALRLLAFCVYLGVRDYKKLSEKENDQELKNYINDIKISPLISMKNLEALYGVSKALEKKEPIISKAYMNAFFYLREWISS